MEKASLHLIQVDVEQTHHNYGQYDKRTGLQRTGPGHSTFEHVVPATNTKTIHPTLYIL